VELVLASNFDPNLVPGLEGLPVESLFGNFPTSLVGGGRPPGILPPVTEETFQRHLREVHASGRRFYATVNTADTGLREYRPSFLDAFSREVGRLVEWGVDGFVVAIPLLLDRIHREYPDVRISVSTFARIRTVAQGEYFLERGADTIVLEEANRDRGLLQGLVDKGAQLEVLVNQTCIHDCPFRSHHLNTSSLASQEGTEGPWFEYPLLQCGLELVKDPVKLISGIFVRPEDLATLEELGVHRFKISGRNHPTGWLLRAARAYSARHYDGNLLDLLSYVQDRGPRGALRRLKARADAPEGVEALSAAFEALGEMELDNRAFPPGFLKHVLATDCDRRSCSECGYCAQVARRVVRIRGAPLDRYAAPTGLPDPSTLLPYLGAGAAGPGPGGPSHP